MQAKEIEIIVVYAMLADEVINIALRPADP
jgi:hypothetical protein